MVWSWEKELTDNMKEESWYKHKSLVDSSIILAIRKETFYAIEEFGKKTIRRKFGKHSRMPYHIKSLGDVETDYVGYTKKFQWFIPRLDESC